MHVDDAALRDYLADSGMLSRRQLDEVVPEGAPLYETLSRRSILSHDELRRAAAGALGIPFVVLERDDAALDALVLIPEPVARTHNVVAFRANGGSLEVAMLDLDELPAIHFLQIEHGLRVLPRLTTAGSIKHALLQYHKHLKERFGERIKSGNIDAATEALLAHALLHRAQAVHLEEREFLSGQRELLARYRVGGKLYDAMTLPREAAGIVAKLKDLSGLSHTLAAPQEGSFKMTREGQETRVRVATVPAHMGERMVLHLSKSSGNTLRKGFSLEALGFHGEALEQMHQLLFERSGLVVVSGRSGKTTLLYTMLDLLASPERAFASVEEEVAYVLPQVVQTAVQKNMGLDTSAALRAVLRQDPDVVLIDAIHDTKTASLALSAAKRGMLVLAASEVPIDGAIAEVKTRVVKRVCHACKEEYRLARAEATPFEAAGADFGKVLSALKEEGVVAQDMQWKDLTFARAVGCSSCEAGYKGVVGVQEVRLKGETAGLNIVEDGLFKAAAGLTTIEEVGAIL